VSAPGLPPVWLPAARLARRWGHPTAVLACWPRGYDRPWLLATHWATGHGGTPGLCAPDGD